MEIVVALELLLVVAAVEVEAVAAVEEAAVDLLAALQILQTRKNKEKKSTFSCLTLFTTQLPLLQPQNNLNHQDLN